MSNASSLVLFEGSIKMEERLCKLHGRVQGLATFCDARARRYPE